MNCTICNEYVNPKRIKIGYKTCLKCGQHFAEKESARRKKCIAPAFNKGPYMYVTGKSMAKDVGK